MTLVTIVMIPLPDNSGPDVDRLEKVEDLHPEIARNMLQYGTARDPSKEELAAYHKTQQAKAEPESDVTTPGEARAPGVFRVQYPLAAGQPFAAKTPAVAPASEDGAQ